MTELVRSPLGDARSEQLVGTWQLVTASDEFETGKLDTNPYGTGAVGRLIYGSDGTVAALVSFGGRKQLSADRLAASPAEQAEAFSTFSAYAGTFTLEGTRVIHHIRVASVENWVGTDLVRYIELRGDQLTLRTPPRLVGGINRVSEVIWRRIQTVNLTA